MGLTVPTVPASIGSWDSKAIVNLEKENPYDTLNSNSENFLSILVPRPTTLEPYTHIATRIVSATNSSNPLAIRGFSIPYYFSKPRLDQTDDNYYIDIPAHLFLNSYKKELSLGQLAWSKGVDTISYTSSNYVPNSLDIQQYTVETTGTTVIGIIFGSVNPLQVGYKIRIIGAFGAEQEKLNGTWTVTGINGNTFTFSVSQSILQNSYFGSSIGACGYYRSIQPGMQIEGPGIAPGTVIISNDNSSFKLSKKTIDTKGLLYRGIQSFTSDGVTNASTIVVTSYNHSLLPGYSIVIKEVPLSNTEAAKINGTWTIDSATGDTFTIKTNKTIAEKGIVYTKTASSAAIGATAITTTSITNLIAGQIVNGAKIAAINLSQPVTISSISGPVNGLYTITLSNGQTTSQFTNEEVSFNTEPYILSYNKVGALLSFDSNKILVNNSTNLSVNQLVGSNTYIPKNTRITNIASVTPVTTTGSGTVGQSTITVASNTGIQLGMFVQGSGIGIGARVILISGTSGTTITLSVPNLATFTSISLAFNGYIVVTLDKNLNSYTQITKNASGVAGDKFVKLSAGYTIDDIGAGQVLKYLNQVVNPPIPLGTLVTKVEIITNDGPSYIKVSLDQPVAQTFTDQTIEFLPQVSFSFGPYFESNEGFIDFYNEIDYEHKDVLYGWNQYYKIQLKKINLLSTENIDFNPDGLWSIYNNNVFSEILTTGWIENTIQNQISPWSSEILFRPILINLANIGIQSSISTIPLWTSRTGLSLYQNNIINAAIFSFNGVFDDPLERIESYQFIIHYNDGNALIVNESKPLSSYEFEKSPLGFFPNYTNISIEWINSIAFENGKKYYITFEFSTVSGYNGKIRYQATTQYTSKPLGLAFDALSDPDNGRIEFLMSGNQVRFVPGNSDTIYGFIDGLDKIASGSINNKTITVNNSTGIVPGMLVYGDGIATGSKVVSISGLVITLDLENKNNFSNKTITFSNENNLAKKLVIKNGFMTNKNLLIWNTQNSSWGVHSIVTGINPLNKIPKTFEDFESNYIAKLTSGDGFDYYLIPIKFIDKEINSVSITKTGSGSINKNTIIVSNNNDIKIGYLVSGTGIKEGSKVASINGTSILLSKNNIGEVSGNITFKKDPLVQKNYNDFWLVKKSINDNIFSNIAIKFFNRLNIQNGYSRQESIKIDENEKVNIYRAYMRNLDGLGSYSEINSNLNYYLFFGENQGKLFLYVKDLTNNKVDRINTQNGLL